MSDTKKHREFVAEPIKDKDVDKLPGIGPVAANNLKNRGYNLARQLLGELLLKGDDQEKFCAFLMEVSGANSENQRICYKALKEFSDNFI